jgi:N-acyl-D-amino-acid deacylase
MFDLLLRGGQVVDGLGSPMYRADVAVQGGRIAAVGDLGAVEAAQTLDCTGLCVSPGWVDIHGHADWNVLEYSLGLNLLIQGSTTTVAGNCGGAPAPMSGRATELLKQNKMRGTGSAKVMHDRNPDARWNMADFLDVVQESRPGVNYIQLAGHNAIRSCVMGQDERQAMPDEVRQMQALVDECIEQGAFGMSSGLVFIPGCWSNTEEVIELARVVGKHNGLYASHIRGERETNIEATQEFIRICEEGGARGQVSHMQSKFPVFSRGVQKIEMLDAALARGVDVACDYEVYMNPGTLAGFLQIYHYTREELLEKLRTSEGRAELKHKMRTIGPWHPLGRFGPGGVAFRRAWYKVLIWDCPHDRSLEGKSVAAVAAERGIDGEDALFDLFVAEDGLGPRIIHDYIEDEHFNILPWPYCIMPSVDTGLYDPVQYYQPIDLRCQKEVGFAATMGMFTRFLGQFVREEKVITLEDAVRRMTSFAMQRVGITDRGVIRPGAWADITVFNKDTVALRSKDADPEVIQTFYPVGISYVLVNGQVTMKGHKYTGVRAGQVLRSS